jgi:hypothetical protein
LIIDFVNFESSGITIEGRPKPGSSLSGITISASEKFSDIIPTLKKLMTRK